MLHAADQNQLKKLPAIPISGDYCKEEPKEFMLALFDNVASPEASAAMSGTGTVGFKNPV